MPFPSVTTACAAAILAALTTTAAPAQDLPAFDPGDFRILTLFPPEDLAHVESGGIDFICGLYPDQHLLRLEDCQPLISTPLADAVTAPKGNGNFEAAARMVDLLPDAAFDALLRRAMRDEGCALPAGAEGADLRHATARAAGALGIDGGLLEQDGLHDALHARMALALARLSAGGEVAGAGGGMRLKRCAG